MKVRSGSPKTLWGVFFVPGGEPALRATGPGNSGYCRMSWGRASFSVGADRRIRRLHSRKNKLEREIARMTGLSRNTVAKWLHGEVDGLPKYRRGEQPTS